MWCFKLMAKMILARIPLRESSWQKLRLFRHGQMDDVDYAIKVFFLHVQRAFPEGLPNDFTILELGPGNSLASGLIASSMGAKAAYLVDVGAYASCDIRYYRLLAETIRRRGLSPVCFDEVKDYDEMLARSHIHYLTEGLMSLKSIPTGSVDFIFSHSVLEHIRKSEFAVTISELHRILRPQGHMSHNVNLQDHLSHSLNNLRFSERFWERNWFAYHSGFYTNRIRAFQMLEMMKTGGFTILSAESASWSKLPTPKHSFDISFRNLSDEELLIHSLHFVLAF